MAVPVFLTDGKTAIDFVGGKLPVDATSNGTGNVNLDTVNTAVTMNVAVQGTPDVTGNVTVSGTPDVTGNVAVTNTPNVNVISNTSDAFTHNTVLVGNTATLVVDTDPNYQGVSLKAHNTNNDTIFIGGSGVTANNGYPLYAGESIALPLSSVNIHAISPTANQNISWIRI